MGKAYDRVHWPFLFRVLYQLGFHHIFIRWSQACVCGTLFALLINGHPTSWFSPTRGLCQGCLLSPYLFIIYFDVLSKFIHCAVQTRLLRACIPRGGPAISHIFFIDDCILVARATIKDAITLLSVLQIYYSISGQAINVARSYVIFSTFVSSIVKHRICTLLNIPQRRRGWKYLGVPLKSKTFQFS